MSTNDSGTGSKMTWDDWSDFDLSLAVAKLVAIDGLVEHSGKAVHIHDYHNGVCLGWKTFWINNPTDMWSIIVSSGISLLQQDNPEGWCAFRWDNDEAEHWHANPLRAAAIVFLEMNGVTPNA